MAEALQRAPWAGAEPLRPGPVVVVVMDGVGIGRGDAGDAVAAARTPNLAALARGPLATRLRAHGKAVGMPSDADMGNSEVGHNAIGAGRVFAQGASRVNDAIASGELFRGETWRALVERAKAGATFHLLGLLSDGNVHSHQDHLHALLGRLAEAGVKRARVHALLDGRDVPERSANLYIDRLEATLSALRERGMDARIASGGGRQQVTMDRYGANWGIVERGYRAHVHGEGRRFRSAAEAVRTMREEEPGIIDQDLGELVIVGDDGAPVGRVEDGDVVVVFNFRGDRAMEICQALGDVEFTHFDRTAKDGRPAPRVELAGMTLYDGDLGIPRRFLVAPPAIADTLGERLVAAGLRQLAVAETQKFGHVTYFWNGNRGEPFDRELEHWREVPSDQVPFEQRPWMKAAEVTDLVVGAIGSGRYDLVRTNFANGDMVGHTGHFDATVLAVEAVDLCLGRIVRACERAGAALLVTADHGNADDMVERDPKTGAIRTYPDGRPQVRTSHSLNPVPLYLSDPKGRVPFRLDPRVGAPGLSHIAATVLTLLGFDAPAHYDPSVIVPA